MNLQQQAKNVAAQGRFGDSMLLHVNPAEVRGLASAMPITINPETGQPEAFLPFLAPLLGSFLGSSLLGGTALGTIGAGALGSGLAQYAVTGDLKKGLLAGLTGYGLGTALQGAGEAARTAADLTTTASEAAKEAVANLGTKQVTDTALQDAVMGSLGQTASTASQTAAEAAKLPFNVAPIAEAGAAAADPTMLQNLESIFKAPGTIDPLTGEIVKGSQGFSLGTGASNLLGGLMQPGAYIPAGIGMGGTAIMESQEEFQRYLDQLDADERRRVEEMYARYPEPIPGTFVPQFSKKGGLSKLQEGGKTKQRFKEAYGMAPLSMRNTTELSNVFSPDKMANTIIPGISRGVTREENFDAAFKKARKALGPGMTFMYKLKGDPNFKRYTTDFKEEKQKPSKLQEGGSTADFMMPDPSSLGLIQDYVNKMTSGINGSGGIGAESPLGAGQFIPQRIANPIPAGFMPGFMPEFSYFSNTTPTASGIAAGVGAGNDVGVTPTPTPGVPMFNPTGTPAYQQFYGSAMQGMPSVINPFERSDPITINPFVPPEPINPPLLPDPDPDPIPIPQPPIEGPPSGPPGNPGDPIIEPFGDDIINPPEPSLEEGEPAISFLPPVLKQEPPVLPGIPNLLAPKPIFDDVASIPEPGDFSDLGPIAPIPMPPRGPIAPRPVMPRPIYEVGDEFNKRNPVFPVDPGMSNAIVPPPPGVSTVIPTPPGGFVRGPDPIMVGGPVLPVNPPVQTNFPINPNVGFPGFMNPMQPKVIGMSAGESTSVEVDKLPEGLKAMYDSGPKGKEGVEKIAAKTDKFSMGGIISKMQTGRMTELQNDPLTVQVVQFLLGNISDDSVIAAFVDKYGPEIFRELRRGVLASIEPDAQTEGMIKGSLEGGMADDIFGSIGDTSRNGQRVALSQDEYVVPADAVSMLGDGSSDAGAKKLDEMLDRIRLDKTGTTTQAKEINDNKVLPA